MATTRSGRYSLKRAQERMTRRNPTARTKDRAMMVLRPAVGMVGRPVDLLAQVEVGTEVFPCGRDGQRSRRGSLHL